MAFCLETVKSLVDDCSVMLKPKGSSSPRNQIKMLSSTALLLLMLCATGAMKVSKPGADLLSPLHPDYLSKVW
ncbi:unnamed protein product [Toxocara canis]|uniref:Ovule protein n=1 Tax=Toxocara canis TaxID=6265 RepID=A0A183VE67_TOXCA|nr:unnamed protein product [Toxocara canis]